MPILDVIVQIVLAILALSIFAAVLGFILVLTRSIIATLLLVLSLLITWFLLTSVPVVEALGSLGTG